MQRLRFLILGVLVGSSWPGGPAAGQVATTAPMAASQAGGVRTPSAFEVQLLQALRANPATASYPFSTEPRGSKVLLRGRVGAKITHDVAIRMAIALGVPIEDGITIDTAFVPGGPAGVGGFGPVPGPGPTTTGNRGFGGPPAFGNYGYGAAYGGGGAGGGYAGGAVGGYNAGFGGPATGGLPYVAAFPSAGSYGGAPSILPPPIFGRYDDPFYGFDPPSVVFPPWWGALNAQRLTSNAAFAQADSNAGAANPGANAGMNVGAPMIQAAGSPVAPSGPAALGANGAATVPPGADGTVPTDMTATDIGLIPDGTIDMLIDGQGVATLRGAVPSMADKVAVGQRVAATPGVAQVVNLLVIKPSLANRVAANGNSAPGDPGADSNTPPPPPVAAGTPAPAGAGVANANRPAAIVSTPGQSSGSPAIEPSGDAGLTDRASRALADRAALLTSPVRVKVKDAVATLTGKVPTVYEAMLAYRSVQQVPGIRGIDDRLEFVVPSGEGSNPLLDRGRPDDVEPYLEAQVKRQVGDFAHIDRVRLQADVLEVRGTLDRAEDRDRFDAILRSMPLLRGFQVRADMPAATP